MAVVSVSLCLAPSFIRLIPQNPSSIDNIAEYLQFISLEEEFQFTL
jgi:hypothetical protein